MKGGYKNFGYFTLLFPTLFSVLIRSFDSVRDCNVNNFENERKYIKLGHLQKFFWFQKKKTR